MEVLVSIERFFIDSEEFEGRWNTVGDEAEHRIRIEGIIFIERWSWHFDIVELIGLKVNYVRSWVLVQLRPLDVDVGSSSE